MLAVSNRTIGSHDDYYRLNVILCLFSLSLTVLFILPAIVAKFLFVTRLIFLATRMLEFTFIVKMLGFKIFVKPKTWA